MVWILTLQQESGSAARYWQLDSGVIWAAEEKQIGHQSVQQQPGASVL